MANPSVLIAVAVAWMLGLAVLGGALGQSRGLAAALDTIGRNPTAAEKIFVPLLLGMSLIESLVILSWIMGAMMLGKMG